MNEKRPDGIDVERITRRLDWMNAVSNEAIKDILAKGTLNVNVEESFRSVAGMIRLIAQICLLKKYAERAGENFNFPITLETWNGFFMEYDKSCHLMPSGKPQ